MPASPTHSRGTRKTPLARPKASERGPINQGLALSSPQISFWKTSQGYKLQRSMRERFLSWCTNPLNSLVIPRLTGL